MDIHKEGNETELLSCAIYKKSKLKMIEDLNVKLETTQFLEENPGSKLFPVTLRNIFQMPCWARETKEKKINKRDYIKLGSLCREGNHQQNVKTTYRKGEGICK